MFLQCAEIEDSVYIHPTSALYKKKTDFVAYQHIHQTSRPYMKGEGSVSTTSSEAGARMKLSTCTGSWVHLHLQAKESVS